MRKPTKTIPFIILDGEKQQVQKVSGGWRWQHRPNGTAFSSSLESIREEVERRGGELVREPNENYERQLEAYVTHRNRRQLSSAMFHLSRLLP